MNSSGQVHNCYCSAADDSCHGLRCFHGKKGGRQALFEIFTGAPPTPAAFGIFLHEVIIIKGLELVFRTL